MQDWAEALEISLFKGKLGLAQPRKCKNLYIEWVLLLQDRFYQKMYM